jgi:manganese/iron transport system permease protein
MSELLNWFAEPFSYSFMTRALWASLVVGIVCPFLGTYVVLRGMAFLGDALAHIVLPGVVIAFMLGWPLVAGALLAGILAALLIGAISRGGELRDDASIGVIFAGAFALGVALISVRGSYAVDLAHILFGNILGVSTLDLAMMTALAAIVFISVFAFYKEFLVLSFDLNLAATLRLPVTFLQNLLLVLLAIVIVISLQAVGITLVLAMLVTPASTAYLLTRRLHSMMAIGAAIGALCSVSGLLISYHLNIASGPAIVLVTTVVFVLIFLFAPQRGVFIQYLRRSKPRSNSPARMSGR